MITPPLDLHVPPPIPTVTPPQASLWASSADALRRALRGSVGCANVGFANLDAEERAKCKERLAAIRAAAPAYADKPGDPAKAAAFARTTRNDEAWSTYRDTPSGQYPGLHCALGRDCGEPGSGAARLP